MGLGKIISIIRAYFNYIQNYSDYYRLNLSVRGERFVRMLQNNEIENAESYTELTVELLILVKDAVSLGVEDGTIRKDLDPLMTTMFIGAAIEAAALVTPEQRVLSQQLGLDTERYTQNSIDVILRGITGEQTNT